MKHTTYVSAQLLEGFKAMWALCASPNQWKPHLNLNIIRTKRAWLQRSLKPENPSTSSNPQSPSAAPPPFMHPPQLNRSFISLDADLTPSPPLATCSHLHLSNWILDQHPAPPSLWAPTQVGPIFCTIIIKPSTAGHVDHLGSRLKWYNFVLYYVGWGPFREVWVFCVYCLDRGRESKEERKIPSTELKYC